MSEKIFLEKNRNVEAINKDNYVDVNLTQKVRLLPFNDLSDKINLADLFNDERDNCEKYRLIFTVNPICSNVLYNMKTEVVSKEGSDECVALMDGDRKTVANAVNTTPVNRIQAIRDTEYSHPDIGGFVYHCGVDIFNNHMLRSKSFIHINKVANTSTTREKCCPVFNTFADYQRDCDGKIVSEIITDSPSVAQSTTDMHVYRIDNFMDMQEAFNTHMKEKDGWFGFTNPSSISIPNGKNDMSINKLMNNNKACEFIDMYPDRSLYSFIPKVNKYRNRVERNWDYCITYPYESDYNKFEEVMENEGIKTLVHNGKTQNGYDLYVFKTVIKHNLSYGDSISITWESGNGYEGVSQITISGLGDVDGTDPEHCFRIYKNQLNIPTGTDRVWIQRLSNGTGCKYYFRKFKKILNPDGSELASSIGKLAFGENIYGDRVGEVVYTDDIDTTGLRDNMGRKLSEIYFTLVKTNRGHDLWYESNQFSNEKVEFSHCFGKVTSGIKMIDDSDTTGYNIFKLHNVELDTVNISLDPPEVLEDDITESNDWFYGDIVEFDPASNKETVLEDVYHRFNTAQRETLSNTYTDNIKEDTIDVDDYEMGVVFDGASRGKFLTGETIVNDEWFPSNIQLEGYYYKPHHRIKIREISNNLNTSIGTKLSSAGTSYEFNNGYVNLVTNDLYDYVVGDVFAIHDVKNDLIYWGVLDKCVFNKDNNTYSLVIETSVDNIENFNNVGFDIILTDGSVPTYASYIPSEEKFVWRDILAPSEIQTNDELSNMMFTNGANYIHKNVNFYVRRQDPFGSNGLSKLKTRTGSDVNLKIDNYKKYGLHFDASGLLYLVIETQNACL